MDTYLALVKHPDNGNFNINQAAAAIRGETIMAEKLGIEIRHLYWTTGSYDAVLVLEAKHKNEIAAWRDRLQNLRIELLSAALYPESKNLMPTGGWNSSCDTIHWSY